MHTRIGMRNIVTITMLVIMTTAASVWAQEEPTDQKQGKTAREWLAIYRPMFMESCREWREIVQDQAKCDAF